MSKKENYNYFDEFIRLTDYIVESAKILEEVFTNFDVETLNDKTVEVHKLENEADLIIHKMGNYLIKDFLPPIDREDIAKIGHKLDDIEDSIDEFEDFKHYRNQAKCQGNFGHFITYDRGGKRHIFEFQALKEN